MLAGGLEEARNTDGQSKSPTRSVSLKQGFKEYTVLPLDVVMRHTTSTVSSDENDEAIVFQDSETLGWYHIQYPDYTAQDNESETSDDPIEQSTHEAVFLQNPLPISLHALLSTIPPAVEMPTAIQGFQPSLIQKIILNYPLTFGSEAVWHAWALSAGKTAVLGLHSLKADSFVLGISIAAV